MIEEQEILFQEDPGPKKKPKFNPKAAYSPVLDTGASKPKFNPNQSFTAHTDEVVQEPKPVQSAFQINISQPTFKGTPAQTPIRTFTDEKPIDPFGFAKLEGKAQKAHEALQAELKGNKDVKEKMIRQRRFEEAAANIQVPRSDMPQTRAAIDVSRIISPETKPQDLPVTEDDLIKEEEAIQSDRGKAVRLMEETMKHYPEKAKEIQKNLYTLDAYNSLGESEEPEKRITKIETNAKELGKGNLIYDIRNGVLIKPQGLVGSAMEGWKQKSQLFADYDFLKNTENDAAIASELEDRRMRHDMDEPIPIPKGKMSEIGQMLGGMPLKPLAAGALASLGGPQAGIAAGAIVGGREFAKMEYASNFQKVYNELRNEGVEKFEAVHKARQQAEQSAEIGAITGGVMGLMGGKIGTAKLAPVTLSHSFKQSVFNFLKQNGNELGKAGLEGLAGGGIGAAGQVYKNKLAQSIGIDRPLDEGVLEQIEGGLLTTVAMAAAIKAGRGTTKPVYKRLMHGLSKLPDEQIKGTLNEYVENGQITQRTADETLNSINEYKGLDNLIPENVTEEARFKIQDEITKRKELETKLENTDKAFHPEIKEKIKAIDEKIIGLSKETEKPIKEETGLSKEKEKEAVELAEEWLDEGIFPDTYETAIKNDPIGFWKEIAQQAQNRDSNWNPLKSEDSALSEQAVRDQFGDTVVDYAMELFPAPEIKETGVSVIMPGEIKQPETITISPREQPADIKSTDKVSVIMPKGSEPETITIKPKEDAIPIGGSEAIPVGETPRSSQEMVEGISPTEELAGTQGQPKESNVSGKEKEINTSPLGEGDVNRLAHSDTEQLYREMGMKERIPRVTKTDITLESQADDLIKSGYDFNAKADKVLSGKDKSFTDTEQVAFAKMVGALKAKLNNTDINSPEFDKIQSQIEKLSRASDIVGSEEGAAFRARRMFVLNDETLSDFMSRAKEVNKDAPLTEQQKADVKAKFDEYDAAKKAYEEKIDKLEADLVKAKAEKKIKDEIKKAKKSTTKDYAAERKQILDDIKKKWDESKGNLGVTLVPYADRLVKIAPDVLKLLKNVIEEGVEKLPDMVKSIHKQIKDLIPEVTERDIHDIIAGEYATKRPSKNEIQEKLYDARTQAALINKLERLEAGIQPKTEKQRIKRNQEIEELRKKIKELTEYQIGDEKKLQSLKTRYKNKIQEYDEKLAKGDFEAAEKPESVTLDDEAQALQDRYIQAKKDWELGLAKKEYENRSAKEKVWDIVLGVLDLRRSIQTAFDFSVAFRQALPVTINPLKIKTTKEAFVKMFSHWYSEKNLDRWWFDLENSSDYKGMLEDGLEVRSPNELRLSKREEEFRTRIGEEIPVIGAGIKASGRAASGYLNSMRVDLYRKGTFMLEAQGKTRKNSPELYEALAKDINNLTGAGTLLEQLKGKPSQLLGAVFFGPKLMAAKFNLLNPYIYAKMPKEIRTQALRDLAVRTGMYVAVGGLLKATGASVAVDPNDPNFLKPKFGKTSYDITGGEAIYVRTMLRILEAAKERITGEEKSGLKSAEKGGKSVTAFFRNKLAPTPSYALDAYLGKTSYGAKFDPYDVLRYYPMWIDDIVEDWKQHGAASILAAGIPSIFGIGVMTLDRSKDKKEESSVLY